MGIERHIKKCGGSPSRERSRTRRKPFPMSTPRLIEMDMGIDHTWKHVQPLGIDLLFARSCELRSDSDDVTISNGKIGITRSRCCHECAVAHNQVILAHRSPSCI